MRRNVRMHAIMLILLIAFGITLRVSAFSGEFHHSGDLIGNRPVAAPTLIPTVSPSPLADNQTPEARVLPDVGSNAGLVIGASVLVLIIIGGVLSARLRPKH